MTTKNTDGAKYKAIIDAAERRLNAQVAAAEKFEKDNEKREAAGKDPIDEPWQEFLDVDKARLAIERHLSFVPFVDAGLLPASIAIRMAVEGRTALNQNGIRPGSDD